MFITAQFAIAKLWNQPRCLSVDEWIKKIKFYSAIKNKIMSLAGKWMELEIIMLNETSQSHKVKVSYVEFMGKRA
jgi:hypothetical protein